ncbi:hypothetical protein [Natronoflexus pectinivorans]|uniref:Uncharacterized protein n=1 Tax=Natronoflexus pectinivorans TaxID=682526 RepID=A0A4R2GLH4_9BACT|nr:hypothetical protein [Natronoflexus pectinivorans]TCO08341.1 hypothetical protein EV194_105145 [Natronoflexus pectinivorans]
MNRFFYVLIGLSLGGISLILHFFYRPYIYGNGLNDFYFSDVFPSLFATPATVFFYFGWSRRQILTNEIIISIYSGLVAYELFSLIGVHKTFDFLDIIALTISMIFLLLLPESLKKKKNQREY